GWEGGWRLAADQMMQRKIGQLEDAGGLHRRAGGRVVLPALEVATGTMGIAAHQDELADVEGTLGRRALRHDAHAPRQVRAREPADGHAFEADLAGRGSSARVRSRVSGVLPELFGPITPTISPAARRSETSESANARREARAGYAKLTRSSSSSISVDIRGGRGSGCAGDRRRTGRRRGT